MSEVLSVKNLAKEFDSHRAVDGISFHLGKGEILGVLGPNGAGKTTTLQMLLGVLTPTSGEIVYFGKNFKGHREWILDQINFSSTYINLPWRNSVYENLKISSYYYSIPDRKKRLEEIRVLFHLEELWKKGTEELSAGQITRVNLAKAFLNYPKILLLDEPTASLDPEIAAEMRKFILEYRDKHEISIIITSHNMAEVEEICDRVIFINDGKIIANDTPDNLASTVSIAHLELLVSKNQGKLKNFCEDKNLPLSEEGQRVYIDLDEKEIASFLEGIVGLGIVYQEISIEKPSLEDYFLNIVGQNKKPAAGGLE